jgi:hypothetical protein
VFYCIYQLCRKMTQKVLELRAPHHSCFTRINAKRGISKINDGRCFPWIFSYRNSISIHSKSKISIIMTQNVRASMDVWRCYRIFLLIFPNQSRVNHWRRFYNRLSDQMERACNERHHVFTTMSANVLKQPYKDQYINVYQKVIDRNVFGYYY